MRIIEKKKNELILLDSDNQVLQVPNTPYFQLRFAKFSGNMIHHVFSENPSLTAYEIRDKVFACNYNNMTITVKLDEKQIDELCDTIQNNDSERYIKLFCKQYTSENQDSILEYFLAEYYERISYKHGIVVDELFSIDYHGNTCVYDPKRKPHPWQDIEIKPKKDIQKYKVIESFDGRDIILDERLHDIVSKIMFLLSDERKNDAQFMVQLPKKIQRWVEIGNIYAPIELDIPRDDEPEFTVPKNLGYFPSPPDVVEHLLLHAMLERGMKVLEPSAGQGHIVDEIFGCEITCCEKFYKNREVLQKKGYRVTEESDFLKYKGFNQYDRVIMNPPFEEQQDIDHVNHAYQMLKPGGKLVSVMANGFTFRNNQKSKRFRELVEKKGYYIDLPDESFKESGTRVKTVITVLAK